MQRVTMALEPLRRLEPVSLESRPGLCQRCKFLPGNGFAEAEIGLGFSPTIAHSARQRLASAPSPAPKPREVKGYSTDARNLPLRATAWWWMRSGTTRLHPNFPATREICREFCGFGPFPGFW